MHADAALGSHYRHVVERLPSVALLDAHTHIGEADPDGFRCPPQALLDALATTGARACVFPMHEPDGYPPANDRTIAVAEAAQDRLIPFCRVDPRAGGVAELRRCLDAGARGLKLHPRAEQFPLDLPEVDELARAASEAQVPVLIHAGRGIPALGAHAVALAARYPALPLILAHAGVCDLSWLAGTSSDHPNLYFDTSWMSPPDLLTLFTLVAPGQILYASDIPYGAPAQSVIIAFRCALQAGLEPGQLASVAGGQLERLLRGEPPAEQGPAPGPSRLSSDPILARIGYYLTWASALSVGGGDAAEFLDLARLACVVGDGAPQANLCRSIAELIDSALASPQGEDLPARFVRLHLLAVAATLAATPDVGAPPAR